MSQKKKARLPAATTTGMDRSTEVRRQRTTSFALPASTGTRRASCVRTRRRAYSHDQPVRWAARSSVVRSRHPQWPTGRGCRRTLRDRPRTRASPSSPVPNDGLSASLHVHPVLVVSKPRQPILFDRGTGIHHVLLETDFYSLPVCWVRWNSDLVHFSKPGVLGHD